MDVLAGLIPSLIDPQPYFQGRLDHLRLGMRNSTLNRHVRGPVKIKVVSSGMVDAVTQKRWLGGHEVRVHNGLLRLMRDIVSLFLARTEIVNDSGAAVTPVDLTHEQAVEVMREMVTHYVVHERWSSSMELMDTELRRERSVSPYAVGFGRRKIAIPYVNWMADFVMAHELGHIILQHLEESAQSAQNAWDQEYHADDAGLLLVKYPILADDDAELYQRMKFVQLNIALAMLFETLALVVRVAGELGKDWGVSHPPGEQRYTRLRLNQIRNGIPERLFTTSTAGLDPPDYVQGMFQEITSAVVV